MCAFASGFQIIHKRVFFFPFLDETWLCSSNVAMGLNEPYGSTILDVAPPLIIPVVTASLISSLTVGSCSPIILDSSSSQVCILYVYDDVSIFFVSL